MRLERLDSYLRSFTAQVLERRESAAGVAVRLDRSAFYPTAGGQPHDVGILSGSPVVDVSAEAAGVWHLLADEGTELAVGAVASGRIDWPRRFTHMQRHTGQHLLSQALIRVGAARGTEYATQSVSLRGALCTLDVTGQPDAAALAAVELEADLVGRAALPVSAFEVPETELGAYRLRRPAKVTGSVRLVAIGDYDLVACGGTHVRSSAEVLPVKIVRREKIKGDLTRIGFVVGAEALADHDLKHEVTAGLSTDLSTPPPGLRGRVADLVNQVASLQEEIAAIREDQGARRAGELLAAADRRSLPGLVLVDCLLSESEKQLFEALIGRLQKEDACVSLLARVDSPSRVQFAFLAGPGAEVDVRPALAAALHVVDGRGGGRPDRAQGAGENATRAEDALAAARDVLVGQYS